MGLVVPKRASELTAQDRLIVGLDTEFDITRSLKAESNQASFTIYNLSQETRKHLQQLSGGAIVKFNAGYEENDGTFPPLSLIFLGKLREVTSAKQGPNWVTKISSGDGDGANGHVSFSIGPGASLTAAINKVIGELKQGIGNGKAAILGGQFLSSLGTTFPSGVVVHGRADQELDRLLRSIGKTYSVQNGDIQILDSGKPNNETAHVLSQANGLIGSPEISTIKNSAGTQVRGGVKARSLLTSQIYPGRQVKIESTQVNGFFRVETAQYSGQSAGSEWYTDFMGTPVQ